MALSIHINETCSCGAKIDIAYEDDEKALKLVRQWRKNHIHTSWRYHYPYTATWGTGYTINAGNSFNSAEIGGQGISTWREEDMGS